MKMLLERKANTEPYCDEWDSICLKIEDLIEEGKCNVLHSLRGQLLGAARAGDHDAQIKTSHQIDDHIKKHHPERFKRAWNKRVKKG